MSEILMVTEYNCETKETVVRPLTDKEIEAHNQARAAYEAEQAELKAAEAAVAEAKASAQAKLAALGLTADEIAALSK